jgi:hypothetical protein
MLHRVQKCGGVPPSSFAEWAAVAAVALAAALVVGMLIAGVVHAQEPSPALLPPGDPRSDGAGPGLGSGPLAAAAAVLLIGLLAAAGALAWARLRR